MAAIRSLSEIERPPVVLLAVIASTFFVGFGGGVVFPILPNLGKVMGFSAFMVGLILSANRFVRLVANAPAGALIDRVGVRRPFVYGLFIEGIATLGYVVALFVPPPEAWFLLARVLWGLGSAAVFATATTIAADLSDGGDRGTNMGVVRGGITMGFPAGLVLGGVISARYSNAVAFSVAAAFALFASVVAYRYVPETHVEAGEKESVKPWDIDTSLPALTVGFVNFGLLFAFFGTLFATLVLFLGATDVAIGGMDPQAASGVFMAGTVLSASVFMLVGGRISDTRESRLPVLVVFIGTFVAGFLLLSQAQSLLSLAVACAFIGAGQGGTSGPMMALLADLTPDERMGRATGTNNVFGDVGGGVGPLISLPLVERFGFEIVYATSALVPLLAGVVLLVGVKKETGTMRPGQAHND